MYWSYSNWFQLKGKSCRMVYIMSKKSSHVNFDLACGEGWGGCRVAALPLGAPLWLSPVITPSHMHIQYDQRTTQPVLGIHMKILYCTINRHVKACNGHYLQLTAMIHTCLKEKKLLKTEVLVQKLPRLQAGWCLQVNPVCVDCLYWPCVVFHTSMQILATCIRSAEQAGHNL